MDPIGTYATGASPTIDGLQMQSVCGGAHSGGGVFINTQDMTRFDLLVINSARWNAKALISLRFITEARQPAEPNPKYDYMCWLPPENPKNGKKLALTFFMLQDLVVILSL